MAYPKARLESVYTPTSRSKQVMNYHPDFLDNLNFYVGYEVDQSQDTGLGLLADNPIGSGIIKTLVDGTIGNGLDIETAVMEDLLPGVPTDVIDKFRKTVEAMWRVYSRSAAMCDFYGEMNLAQMERLALLMGAAEGDCLEHIGIADVDGLYLPRIQIISGRLVSSPFYCDTESIVAGVERDRHGRTVAYHVAQVSPTEAMAEKWVRRPRHSKTGRLMFNLIKFNEIEAGLVRGRSIFNPVKELIIQTGRFTEAEVTKAIIQACITLFIEKSDETIEDPVDGGLTAIEDSRVTDPQTSTPEGAPDDPITLAPGAAYDLSPGEKAHLAESTAPVAEFKEFMEGLLKIVGTAVGIPYEVLLKCFNSNYSASRAAIQDAARAWGIWRDEFAAKFLKPIYTQFVYCLVKQGLVEAPGYLDGNPFVKAAWEGVVWHGPAILDIDPIKSVTASKLAIDAGLSTHEIEARKLYGNDFDANIKRLGEELRMFAENGVNPETGGSAGNTDNTKEENNDGTEN